MTVCPAKASDPRENGEDGPPHRSPFQLLPIGAGVEDEIGSHLVRIRGGSGRGRLSSICLAEQCQYMNLQESVLRDLLIKEIG